MTDDVELAAILRSALPPLSPGERSRDLWPLVMKRSRAGPKWSWLDVGLAAGAATALWMRPELLALLAYHF
jgi:hypothetical protein